MGKLLGFTFVFLALTACSDPSGGNTPCNGGIDPAESKAANISMADLNEKFQCLYAADDTTFDSLLVGSTDDGTGQEALSDFGSLDAATPAQLRDHWVPYFEGWVDRHPGYGYEVILNYMKFYAAP